MVAFGGLGLSLDPALFGRWPDHHFLVSDPGVAAAAANTTLIPADLRPLELLPLCGRVITKPGYSTFCEALSQGTGIHGAAPGVCGGAAAGGGAAAARLASSAGA